MGLIENYLLSLLIFLPTVFGVLTLISKSDSLAKILALGGSSLVGVLSLILWVSFDAGRSGLQFTEAYEWIPRYGIKYIVGVDGISLLLVVLSALLVPLVIVSSWHVTDKVKSFFALMLFLETGMLGALLAIDLVFFYVFWEIMLIPMYFMIGLWGGKERIYATTKFFIYTVVGSLLMLAAAIALYLMHYDQFGVWSTSLIDLYRVNVPVGSQGFLFAAFGLAFAIKVPIWPFHTWLPDAHTEAPTAGSVLLAGVLLKMGTYGLLRFAIPLFPDSLESFGPYILGMGVVGIIYGALTAWMQKDAKKMVAYSSVSHLGFVVVGSVAFTDIGLSVEALIGAFYQMVNHGISTGALFLLIGMIYERRHSRLLADFGGVATVMPKFAFFLIVATMGSVGLPGTGGFIGEFLILIGLFKASPVAAILAATGVLLGAVYMLTLCRKILFGPVGGAEVAKMKDLSTREVAVLAPLAVLIVAMGVVPNLFLDKSKGAIEDLAKNWNRYELRVAEKTVSGPTVANIESPWSKK